MDNKQNNEINAEELLRLNQFRYHGELKTTNKILASMFDSVSGSNEIDIEIKNTLCTSISTCIELVVSTQRKVIKEMGISNSKNGGDTDDN